MTGPDTILWQSAQNLLRAQDNLNKLLEAFSLVECSDADLTIEEEDADGPDEEFLQPLWNCFYLVKRSNRKNAKVLGVLTLAIQLTSEEGDEGEWTHGRRAKVLVGYSNDAAVENAWEFTTDFPNQTGCAQECISNGLHWTVDDPINSSWFYAIPLDHLIGTQEVRELIVKPVHKILRSGNVGEGLTKIGNKLCPPP